MVLDCDRKKVFYGQQMIIRKYCNILYRIKSFVNLFVVLPAASCQGWPQCLVACYWGQMPAAPPLQSSSLDSC